MNYQEYKNIVITELDTMLNTFNISDINYFIDILVHKQNSNIIAYGAGRMGYGIHAFIMRLIHLGYHAYWYGDTTIPSIGKNDIFIFSSASGKTETIVKLAEIVKKKSNAMVISLTGNVSSPLAKLSDNVIQFKSCNNGLNSEDSIEKIDSIQPMTTLNEQSAFIFFDIVTLLLMERLNENNKTMTARHSIIE